MRNSFTDSVRCYREASTFLVCQMVVGLLAAWAVLSAVPAAAQTCPGFPARAVQVIDALYNPTLANGPDDDRRKLTRTILEQLAFEMPGDGWTWKSADPGRPPSKDSLARLINGRLCNWDWQNGTTRQRGVQAGTLGEDITGQNPIPVAAMNHLQDTPSRPEPASPALPAAPVYVPTPLDYGRLEAYVRDQVQMVIEQNERIRADELARDAEQRAQLETLQAQLRAHDESPSWLGKVFGNRYTQLVMGAAAAWVTAQQTTK